MIGSAKLIDGLYYFVKDELQNKRFHSLSSVCSTSVKMTFCYGICRLKHPNFFFNLKKIMPQLFHSIDYSKIEFEHCIYLKVIKVFILLKLISLLNLFILYIVMFGGPLRMKQFLENAGLQPS